MKTGHWEKINGKTLSECTLGVIGVGNVGKAVLRRARAFGMNLLGNDVVEIAPDFLLEHGVEMTSLEDLLERSDFISVNCTLNPTSHHLINEDTLKLCNPNAVLINTARGPIVKETALVAALEEGRLRGAALDVFEFEPLPLDSPLLKMDQVLLAPHNSNSSPYFLGAGSMEHDQEFADRFGYLNRRTVRAAERSCGLAGIDQIITWMMAAYS